jgi:hypothetical protein
VTATNAFEIEEVDDDVVDDDDDDDDDDEEITHKSTISPAPATRAVASRVNAPVGVAMATVDTCRRVATANHACSLPAGVAMNRTFSIGSGRKIALIVDLKKFFQNIQSYIVICYCYIA